MSGRCQPQNRCMNTGSFLLQLSHSRTPFHGVFTSLGVAFFVVKRRLHQRKILVVVAQIRGLSHRRYCIVVVLL